MGDQTGEIAAGPEDSEKNHTGDDTLQQAALKKAFVTLRDRAFRYLIRREHSASELRRKLARFDEHDLSDYLVETLIEDGSLSDLRFAEHLGRVRTSTGKGPMVLRNELKKHCIEPAIIEQVMSRYDSQWSEMAERVRVRKFGDELPGNYREWTRQARFLQQRGFSAEHIRRVDD